MPRLTKSLIHWLKLSDMRKRRSSNVESLWVRPVARSKIGVEAFKKLAVLSLIYILLRLPIITFPFDHSFSYCYFAAYMLMMRSFLQGVTIASLLQAVTANVNFVFGAGNFQGLSDQPGGFGESGHTTGFSLILDDSTQIYDRFVFLKAHALRTSFRCLIHLLQCDRQRLQSMFQYRPGFSHRSLFRLLGWTDNFHLQVRLRRYTGDLLWRL